MVRVKGLPKLCGICSSLGLRVDETNRLASARKSKIGQHQEARLSEPSRPAHISSRSFKNLAALERHNVDP